MFRRRLHLNMQPQFEKVVAFISMSFDNSTWPGDLNASIWHMFRKISRCWFWDMATLTPLFWANYKFLWVSCIFGGKYVAKWYFLFSALVCYPIIQKWPKSVCQPCKKFQKFFLCEILLIILLVDGNVEILWYETSKCLFFAFF